MSLSSGPVDLLLFSASRAMLCAVRRRERERKEREIGREREKKERDREREGEKRERDREKCRSGRKRKVKSLSKDT